MSRFVIEEDSLVRDVAYVLVQYRAIMSNADFSNVPYNQLNEFCSALISGADFGLGVGVSIFSLILRHVLPITIFGSGRSDLVQKFTNLLHALRLDVGTANHMLDRYRHSVLSITTDKGTEAGLARMPVVEQENLECDIMQETRGMVLEVIDETQSGLSASIRRPPDQVAANPVHTLALRSPNGGQFDASVSRYFPYAIEILGSKHLLDNLLHDVTGAMEHFDVWLDTGLKPIARLLSARWWRERFRAQCSANTLYDNQFITFDASIEHVDIRWGELANLVQAIWHLKEALTHCWDLGKMGFVSQKADTSRGLDGRSLQLIDKAIRCKFFWAYTYLVFMVAWQTEEFSHWHEQCSCHAAAVFHEKYLTKRSAAGRGRADTVDNQITPTGCINAGRRAPDLACGAAEMLIEKVCNFGEVGLPGVADVVSYFPGSGNMSIGASPQFCAILPI